jgi:hypothetical protein
MRAAYFFPPVLFGSDIVDCHFFHGYLLFPENCNFAVILPRGGGSGGRATLARERDDALRGSIAALCPPRFLRRRSVGTRRQVGLPRLRRDIRPATMHLETHRFVLQYDMFNIRQNLVMTFETYRYSFWSNSVAIRFVSMIV